jgi:hypothetical protein
LDQLSSPATVPPKLSFNVAGRFRELRPEKAVNRLSHGLFLGPAIECVCAAIPKNNAAAAETTYENGIITLEQKSRLFFDDLLDEMVFVNPPSMALAGDQTQPCGTSHAILRFAKMFFENINEFKFIVSSFHEVLLF